jgi:PilZ domain
MKKQKKKRKAKEAARAAGKNTTVAVEAEIVQEPASEVEPAMPEAVAIPEAVEPVMVPEPEEQAVVAESKEQVTLPEVQEQVASSSEEAQRIAMPEPVEIPLEIELEIEQFMSSVDAQAESVNPPRAEEPPAEIKNPAGILAVPPAAEQQEPKTAEPPAPSKSDRRAHPRYAFTAFVEVVDAYSGTRVTTRVRDVSQQGCYVDTDRPFGLGTTTGVRITKGAKSFEARARVVFNQPGKGMGLMFTAVEANHVPTLEAWIGESRETSWLAANRRRSQRVLMKIPVRVSGQTNGTSFFEDTHTLAVSAHGASLVVARQVSRGERLALLNLATKETLECVVAHIGSFPGEPPQVGVEFMLPNPTFWRVAFPPKDWTPRHPDAKSSKRVS